MVQILGQTSPVVKDTLQGQKSLPTLTHRMASCSSMGLGSYIVRLGAQVTGDEEVVETLELKDNMRIYAPVVVGCPQIVPEPPRKTAPAVRWN